MIAQVTPPVEIAAWLACLSFLFLLFNQAAKAKDTLLGKKHEISPQPLEVKFAETLVTKSEHSFVANRMEQIETEVKDLREERNKDMDQLRTERERDMNALHEKINDVKNVSIEVRTSANLLNQRLHEVSAKLDRCREWRDAGACLPKR